MKSLKVVAHRLSMVVQISCVIDSQIPALDVSARSNALLSSAINARSEADLSGLASCMLALIFSSDGLMTLFKTRALSSSFGAAAAASPPEVDLGIDPRTVPNSQFGSSMGPLSSLSESSSDDDACPPLSTQRRYLSIKSTRADVFFAFVINLCFFNSFVVGLFAGSLFRQSDTKSLKPLVKSPSSDGGGFFGIKKSTRIGCKSEFGGSPFANSMAVTPSDQISAFPSYADNLMTSGAIQKGVPTNVVRFVIVSVN
mmetsp:Transcript_145414/g.205871  ORF Transcript_145414/g.205871 Transcript_145414/m.205871 type:complete len:256 (-) Transcript_145414:496-1263(-)